MVGLPTIRDPFGVRFDKCQDAVIVVVLRVVIVDACNLLRISVEQTLIEARNVRLE